MLDKLTEDQRRVLMIWFFFLVFLVVLFIILAGHKITSKFKDEVDKNYSIVQDYSRYYTVINILDKYYTALNNESYDDVLKMLDTEYVNSEGINKDNIKEKLNKYDVRTTYKGSLMCSKKLGKGYTSYYVSGEVVGTNTIKTFDTTLYEVVLNENEMTFSIKQIDDSQFGGDCHA